MICLVTSINPYDFTPKGSDRRITGCKVTLFDTVESEDTSNRIGKKPTEVKVPNSLKTHFVQNGPGFYNLDFVPLAKGNTTEISIGGVQPIKPMRIEDIIKSFNK